MREPRSGTTFIGGLPGRTEHLYIIITEPDSHDQVVIVNVTTFRALQDNTVLLQPGDHPFIHHASCIYYRGAKLAKIQDIDKAIHNGSIRVHAELGAAILERIRRGAVQSKFTAQEVKDAVIPYLI